MKYLFAICFSIVGVTLFGQIIEAESGERLGTQTSTQLSGYSGNGYVTGFDSDGDKVTVKIRASGGIYKVYIRFASPHGEKFNFLMVNGQNMGSVSFPMAGSFRETLAGKVFLESGENSIAILKDWGYIDIDNFRIEASEAAPIYNIGTDLVTPSASEQADSLYDLLSSLYGKSVLSGQYGGDTELNKIKTVSGKLPVIRGFDLMDYSPSRVERGGSSTETEKAIEWSRKRGIVTFAWHWNAPKDLIDQPGKEWWRGFYTEATNFDVSKAMNDPGSEEYSLLIRDMDAIAVQLQKLEDANIPVLWRPLHESEGMWFWWGAKGAEPCKWLWKLLFERIVNHHHISNLIWVWTSTSNASALDWYPGDQYVDIIGADIYLPDGTYGSSFAAFDNMAALYEGRKIIALSENGPIPDPERLFLEEAAWSWFCTWSGGFITNGVTNTSAHINHVFNHEYTITLDEIDSLDSIVVRLEKRREQLEDEEPVVGIGETAESIGVFPNPLKGDHDELLITNCCDVIMYELIDVHGRMILRHDMKYSAEQQHINVEGLSPGIYFLKVRTDVMIRSFRILKL